MYHRYAVEGASLKLQNLAARLRAPARVEMMPSSTTGRSD